MSRRGQPGTRRRNRRTAAGRSARQDVSARPVHSADPRRSRQERQLGHGGWRAALITFGALMVLWVMLWGSVSPSLLLVGAASALLVLWLFPLPPMEFRFGLHPWRALILLGRFLWDVVLASLHVAALALRPRPPHGAVMQVQLVNDSDLLQHLTGLAVSLVPGSLIINADPDRRTLLIHLLDVEHDPKEQMTRSVLAQEERIRAALAYSPRSEEASSAPGGEHLDGPDREERSTP